MLDKQRLTYLEHLGLSNYMPRRVLPHAAPSQLLSDELLQEPSAFSTSDQVVPTVAPIADGIPEATLPIEGAPSVEALLSGSTEPVAKPPLAEQVADREGQKEAINTGAPTQESSPEPATEKNPEQALKFTLHIWRINNDLLVVDSRQPGTALPTDRLLQNILRSIGYPLAQLPSSELLRWPLFSSLALTAQAEHNEHAEARAMVQAYIAAQCGKTPTKTILLLGQDAASFSLTPDVDNTAFFLQHQGTTIEHAEWQSMVVVAPSLIDMLQEPMKKKITWQALQSLQGA